MKHKQYHTVPATNDDLNNHICTFYQTRSQTAAISLHNTLTQKG